MAKKQQKDPFWTSYSDLMTSLFFVMLVLFIISFIKVSHDKQEIEKTYTKLAESNNKLDSLLHEANADKEQLQQILQLEEQFNVLSQSTSLAYDTQKKMFYAKELVGIEIFFSNDDNIKEEYLETVDNVGSDLIKILESLYNENFHYQLVIEGNAAIRWNQLMNHTFNPDNTDMYLLSYRRALALYNRWRTVGEHDFRKYNTEIIIAGSGFNGNNRDNLVEENNKRFVIQIIPKINRPEK